MCLLVQDQQGAWHPIMGRDTVIGAPQGAGSPPSEKHWAVLLKFGAAGPRLHWEGCTNCLMRWSGAVWMEGKHFFGSKWNVGIAPGRT